MEPKAVYKIGSREIHMMGDTVGVTFPLKQERRKVVIEGSTFEAVVWVRNTVDHLGRPVQPYINFYTIRTDGGGDPWIDEDSPVAGGIDTDYAKEVAAELLLAAEYISELAARE